MVSIIVAVFCSIDGGANEHSLNEKNRKNPLERFGHSS